MSYSLSEARGDYAALSRNLAKAAKVFPDASHVSGRIWSVDKLDDPEDVLVTDEGVYACVWIGAGKRGSVLRYDNAVCIRERSYAPTPKALLNTLAESQKWRAELIDAVRRK